MSLPTAVRRGLRPSLAACSLHALVSPSLATGAAFPSPLDLETIVDGDGSLGIAINGSEAQIYAGVALSSAGDLNGDGLTDLALGSTAPGNSDRVGEAYVVFGHPDAGVILELGDLTQGDGSVGFTVVGSEPGDRVGREVAGLGDVNGDGFDDLYLSFSGSSDGAFVILGRQTGFPPSSSCHRSPKGMAVRAS